MAVQPDTTTSTSKITGTAPAGAVFEQLDPTALLVDVNVRRDATPDEALVDSVRDLGVLVPLVAVRTDAGIRVRYGHRRTLAAIAAGQAAVPVWVLDPETAGGDVERLVAQWHENETRAGLTEADRLGAVEQLAAFGVSPAQITKKLQTRRTQVDAALTTAASALAKGAVERYDFLDLTQAATVAEFDTDPDAVTALVAAAKSGQFDHVAQRLRDDRAETAKRQALTDELTAAGVTLVDRPGWDEPGRALTRLADGDGEPLTPDRHAACPGHAAYLDTEYDYLDPATGQPLTGEQLSALDDAEDKEPDGTFDRTTQAVYGPVLRAVHVCTDPQTHGHQPLHGSWPGGGTSRTPAAEPTDEQREATRAARRDVIESNKAWASAEQVRREWLRIQARRKAAPKGAARFLATALACDPEVLTRGGGHLLADELLGCSPTVGYGRSPELAGLIDQAPEARTQVLALFQVLAGYEDDTTRNDWRHPRAGTARYLRFLEACGYSLADVERRACGDSPSPDPQENAEQDG